MVGLSFFFEPNDVDVWSGRRIDLDAWNYAAKSAGDVDRMVIVNRTDQDIGTPDAGMDVSVVSEETSLWGNVVYVCCPWEADACDRAESLWSFDHDVDWYAFGPAAGWHRSLSRGIYVPQAGRAALHATHIASVVLLHRFEVLRGR